MIHYFLFCVGERQKKIKSNCTLLLILHNHKVLQNIHNAILTKNFFNRTTYLIFSFSVSCKKNEEKVIKIIF